MSDLQERMTNAYGHIDSRWDEDRSVFVIKLAITDTLEHQVEVMPLLFTAAIVTTPVLNPDGHLSTYDDRWCYHSLEAAIAAADAWDPTIDAEPAGWHRHPTSGRRRDNGDPVTEYVSP